MLILLKRNLSIRVYWSVNPPTTSSSTITRQSCAKCCLSWFFARKTTKLRSPPESSTHPTCKASDKHLKLQLATSLSWKQSMVTPKLTDNNSKVLDHLINLLSSRVNQKVVNVKDSLISSDVVTTMHFWRDSQLLLIRMLLKASLKRHSKVMLNKDVVSTFTGISLKVNFF